MRNRRGIVYYRLKESTFGKIYVSLYETWKKKNNFHWIAMFWMILKNQ